MRRGRHIMAALLLGSTLPAAAAAQRAGPGQLMTGLTSHLYLAAGFLTAPDSDYRRTSPPGHYGLRVSVDLGSRIRLQAGIEYASWSESEPMGTLYRELIGEILEPAPVSITPRSLVLRTSLLWRVGPEGEAWFHIGPSVGLRRYHEAWRYRRTFGGGPPGPSGPEQEHLTLGLEFLLPLTPTAEDRYLFFRNTWTAGVLSQDAISRPLSDPDGFQVGLVTSLVTLGGLLGGGSSIAGGGVADALPGQMGIVLGVPTCGQGVPGVRGDGYYGLRATRTLGGRWVLLAGAVTGTWSTDRPGGLLTGGGGPSIPSGIPLSDDWQGEQVRFLPSGRFWEIEAGLLRSMPPLRGLPWWVGGGFGIRRHQEWWDWFRYDRMIPDTPPPGDPGAEVLGLLDLHAALRLGSTPGAPQVQVGYAIKLGRIWPAGDRSSVSADGFRFALMLPVGSF